MSTTIISAEREVPAYGAMFNTWEIERANRAAGFHFFDADTKRFFGSRVLDGVYGGRFFVTSEKSGFDDPARQFTVREMMPDGSIEDVDGFGAYSTAAQARGAARRAARESHTYYFDGRHGKAGRERVYVVTAGDPWEAMERLHANFRVRCCGRARDYMLTGDARYVRVSS